MKKIIIQIFSYTILIGVILFLFNNNKKLNNELSISTNNLKAYAEEVSELKLANNVFQMTIENLEFLGDSLMRRMKEVANENGIKDKNIKALQYQLEHFNKTDTLFIRDTIFKDPDFIIDTCIMDYWSTSCLHLQYPNMISIDNQFYNDKYMILDSHKEPIKPRKWFLTKWLTKKQVVVEVTIVDENPYVTTERQRFVEIIR